MKYSKSKFISFLNIFEILGHIIVMAKGMSNIIFIIKIFQVFKFLNFSYVIYKLLSLDFL